MEPSEQPTFLYKDVSYAVGDHVYVAPPCDTRDCSPYVICRIISLPDGTKPSTTAPTFRVAYYLRRRDVTNRSLSDHRTIFATFSEGHVPAEHVRAKCQVLHRDYVIDEDTYKRQPDCFVFSQLYDRFMHKPFELIPTSQVANAPEAVLRYLQSSYEFVCTELSNTVNLCDARQGCIKCHAFAAKDASVTCYLCDTTFHLSCVEPPLVKKPEKGWQWTCIPCTLAESASSEDDAATPRAAQTSLDQVTRGTTRVGTSLRRTLRPVRKKAKRGRVEYGQSGSTLVRETNVAKWKSTNGWPYRYFGTSSDVDRMLDSDDPIWPRSTSRLGSRFQVSELPGDTELSNVARVLNRRTVKRYLTGNALQGESARGGETTVTRTWAPEAVDNPVPAAVDTFLDAVRGSRLYADTGSTVDLLDFSLRLLAETKHPSAALARLVAMSESDDLPPIPSLCKWSDAEKEELGKQLALHGDDLASAIQSFPGRTLFQLVHLFYRTAGHAVPDHSIHKQVHDIADPTLAVASSVIVPAPHIDAESADPAAAGAPVDTLSSQAENAPDDDDTISHKSLDLGSTADRACAICQKAQAVKWYKCPDGLGEASEVPKQKVMCPSCSTQWRRYGDSLPALTPEELDARAARDGKMRQRRSLLQRGLDLAVAPSETASGETSRADTPNLEIVGALSAKLGRSGSQVQQGPKKVGRPVPPSLMQPKSAVSHGETLPDGALPASPNVLPTPLCVLCKRTEPKHQSYSCKDCGVVCHSGCYGIFSASATEDWQCDGCASGAGSSACCAICPPSPKGTKHASTLKVYKTCKDGRLVHHICALFHPEPIFDDADHLLNVDGLDLIAIGKYEEKCTLCETSGLAPTIKCVECSEPVHVACAWLSGYRLGFQVCAIPDEYIGQLPTVQFKKETGDCRPVVSCRHHPLDLPQKIYDLGQRHNRRHGLTMVMTYAEACKSREAREQYPLWARLREAEHSGLKVQVPTVATIGKDSTSLAARHTLDQPVTAGKSARTTQIHPQRAENDPPEAPEASAEAVAPVTADLDPKLAPLALEARRIGAHSSGLNGVSRKRKARRHADVASDDSISDDEVMPVSSTARSRGQPNRAIRGVRMADLVFHAPVVDTVQPNLYAPHLRQVAGDARRTEDAATAASLESQNANLKKAASPKDHCLPEQQSTSLAAEFSGIEMSPTSATKSFVTLPPLRQALNTPDAPPSPWHPISSRPPTHSRAAPTVPMRYDYSSNNSPPRHWPQISLGSHHPHKPWPEGAGSAPSNRHNPAAFFAHSPSRMEASLHRQSSPSRDASTIFGPPHGRLPYAGHHALPPMYHRSVGPPASPSRVHNLGVSPASPQQRTTAPLSLPYAHYGAPAAK